MNEWNEWMNDDIYNCDINSNLGKNTYITKLTIATFSPWCLTLWSHTKLEIGNLGISIGSILLFTIFASDLW